MNKYNINIQDKIYIIRNQQVMLDVDLAKLYGYEVKRLNEQVKRNIERFPIDFMFQLTKEEIPISLKSQIATLNKNESKRGKHIKKMPYAFSEQGIYMLATVLKGEIAINQSIFIMRAFKQMRHYIAENKMLLNNDLLKLSNTVIENKNEIINIKQTMATKDDINKIMDNFIDDKVKEITILNGQKFEAKEAYTNIYKQAKHTIYIIDDYININTLSLLKCKNKDVEVIIFSDNKGKGKNYLSIDELNTFNEEYPKVLLRSHNNMIHDRYIIIDYNTSNEIIYHCGASSKDAGSKVCSINQLNDKQLIKELINTMLVNNY